MASKSKKSKKVVVEESSAVVPVVFLSSTAYGRKGSFGYIPESFAAAWIDKGIVVSAATYVTEPEVSVAKDVVEVVDDEDESAGKPERAESSHDDSVYGVVGERSSSED